MGDTYILRKGAADPTDLAGVTATAAEINKLASSGAAVPSGTVQSSIADLSVTGTYATDDTSIETAVNEIIAVLLEFGMIEAAA